MQKEQCLKSHQYYSSTYYVNLQILILLYDIISLIAQIQCPLPVIPHSQTLLVLDQMRTQQDIF